MLTPDGRIDCPQCPELHGLDRFVARKKAAAMLEEMGLLLKVEEYENNVGFSERAHVPVEPRISMQWFLKYPCVKEAADAVANGEIKFRPERWAKTYAHWMENLQDWCISRQLWWGHQIPVWYRKDKLEALKNAESLDMADLSAGDIHVGIEPPADAVNWTRDEDVMDTWFSSWLWPFATMGDVGEKSPTLAKFYPTTDLVTGPDIIFFWVARMIMAGLEFMRPGEPIERRIPFRHVYFTGIIRDSQGRKMSKSLGNSPDPLDLIEKYGADGLRLGIVSIAPQGQDIRFQEDRIESGKNFCNKLWNACRFRQMSGPAGDNSSVESILARLEPARFDADDHAILDRMLATSREVARCFAEFEFSAAAQALYGFFWNDFCDWYVEVSKAKLQDPATKGTCLAIQDLVLRQTLLQLHPFIPFITEELWHLLGYGPEQDFIQRHQAGTGGDLLRVLRENGIKLSAAKVADVALLREFVASVRGLKSQANQATRRDSIVTIVPKDAAAKALLESNRDKLSSMAGLAEITFADDAGDRTGSLNSLGTVLLELSGTVDVAAEKIRLAKELTKLEQAVAAGEAKLTNDAFVSKAPPKILEGARKQLDDAKAKRDEIARMLATLG